MTSGVAVDALAYYSAHGPITDPGGRASMFEGLPWRVSELVQVVLGLVLHPAAAARQGIDSPPERRADLQLRHVSRMLERILALDPRPLGEPRPPERRLVGNCRDAAVLLCAMLRHQGRPARARAGFATYLASAFFTDHWACEHWEPDERRWVAVDPGLPRDAVRGAFGFDTLDLPPDRFVVAPRAWWACRRGEADPARFGMPELPEKNGVGWVASQLVRDLAALNKQELLCWDVWGLSRTAFTAISEEEAGLLDRVASTAASDGDEAFRRWRALYQKDRRLVVPDDGRWCARAGPGPRQAPDLEPGHRRMDERLGEPGAHRSSGKARAARHG